MGKRAAPAPSGIVTSDSVRRPYLRRRQLLLAGVAVVALLAGAGGVYVLRSGLLAPRPAATPSASLTPAQQLAAAQIEVQQASTKTEKATAYSNLGAAYQANNQNSQAATAYQQSVSYNPQDVDTLETLVGVYKLEGNEAAAVDTMKQVVSLLKDATDLISQNTVARYQAEISAQGQ